MTMGGHMETGDCIYGVARLGGIRLVSVALGQRSGVDAFSRVSPSRCIARYAAGFSFNGS